MATVSEVAGRLLPGPRTSAKIREKHGVSTRLRGDDLGRSQRLVLAIVGLVGLVGWYAFGLALDARLIHGLQDSVVAGNMTFWWALRFGLPLIAVALACVALLLTMRHRPTQGWFVAVLVVLLGPLVLRGLPLRLGYLPYYVFSALYLVLALSARNPGRKT